MANRYMAFGYEIIDGAVCIVEKEAEVVRNIYLLYIQGLSLQNISDRLKLLPIAYSDDGRPWNKNIVKRIRFTIVKMLFSHLYKIIITVIISYKEEE